MRLGVLGPVECNVDGRPVEVSGRLNRALLAVLAVHVDRVTAVDELIDALWGLAMPAAAEKVVRNRVSSLRAALTPAFIETAGKGYRLGTKVAADVREFADERRTPAERLALWRGDPFEEIEEWPPARAAAVRLGELRAHLEETALAEQLDRGVVASLLVGPAEELVGREPFREHRWALLMRTLYLAGRQHDALGAFQRARQLLRDELGLSPGAELVDLERAIIHQEPSLGTGGPAVAAPSGTLTFLFTDIEGSTRLWADDRAAMSASLAVHDAIVRGAIEERGGYVFATAGDSFAAAFGRASDAIQAARNAQLALAGATWPGPALRVRMGMHIGEAEERGGDYFGPVVNTAARVAAAGHGGQVLMTELVRAAAAVTGAADLGVHRLRDVPEPLRLFQLGDHDFPPLRVVDPGLSNLPVRASRLFGRERDVARVSELLATNRLVTVTAVGGAGKTRLAIAVGEAELPHRAAGVWLADLTAIVNGADLPMVIAKAVGLTLQVGDPTDQVIAYLADKLALLILDNCEHVIDACAEFAERFLSVAGATVLLATSREALAVEGERTLLLGPLPSDGPDSPCVELFVDRATAIDEGFELTDANAATVAALCTRLDGMPLAVALAAARISVMTPAELLDGLADRFETLAGGRRRERHRTLAATLDWSYHLLEPDQQVVFRALGVFVDGFDVAAVAAVTAHPHRAAVEAVEALVAKSLVMRLGGHEQARFRLLETVRAYAEDRLRDAGEDADVRAAHLQHFRRLAAPYGRRFFGEMRLALRLRPERGNLSAAFEWGASAGHWVAVGEMLVGGYQAYVFDGFLPELKTLIERAIGQCETHDADLADYLRAVSLPTIAWLGDFESYIGITESLSSSPVTAMRVFAWTMRSYLEASSHPDDARRHLARAQTELKGRQDERNDVSLDLAAGMMAYIPAVLAAHAGDPASALRHARQALDIEEGNDYHTVLLLSATQLVAACEIVLGDPVGALETLSVVDRFQLAFYAGDEIRALAYLALGEVDQAERFIRINVERAAKGRIGGQVADSVLLLAALADVQGDRAVATQLLLQMGVGNHAATRMFSTELAARLNVTEEHSAVVRRARTSGDTGAPAMTALQHELIRRGWS